MRAYLSFLTFGATLVAAGVMKLNPENFGSASDSFFLRTVSEVRRFDNLFLDACFTSSSRSTHPICKHGDDRSHGGCPTRFHLDRKRASPDRGVLSLSGPSSSIHAEQAITRKSHKSYYGGGFDRLLKSHKSYYGGGLDRLLVSNISQLSEPKDLVRFDGDFLQFETPVNGQFYMCNVTYADQPTYLELFWETEFKPQHATYLDCAKVKVERQWVKSDGTASTTTVPASSTVSSLTSTTEAEETVVTSVVYVTRAKDTSDENETVTVYQTSSLTETTTAAASARQVMNKQSAGDETFTIVAPDTTVVIVATDDTTSTTSTPTSTTSFRPFFNPLIPEVVGLTTALPLTTSTNAGLLNFELSTIEYSVPGGEVMTLVVPADAVLSPVQQVKTVTEKTTSTVLAAPTRCRNNKRAAR